MSARKVAAAVVLFGMIGPVLQADEIRYYEQNGVTYRETRRTVDAPAPEVRYQACPQTVCREQWTTEMREVVRTSWTPVTEYRWESYWVNRWNPFAEPYQAYRYVPHVRWEQRTEVVRVPVECRRLVAETQNVQVPGAGPRTASREIISRVAVSGNPPGNGTIASNLPRPAPMPLNLPPPPANVPDLGTAMVPVEAPSTARRNGFGGIMRYGEEPPRYGQRPIW